MRRPRALKRLALAALAAAVVAAAPAAARKWADPGKVLRVTFPIAETGFDPQATSDLYSGHVQRAIFEPLYAYDYLARPYRLVPNTASALPEISPDGRTWTIRIRPGSTSPTIARMKGQAPAAGGRSQHRDASRECHTSSRRRRRGGPSRLRGGGAFP